MHAKDLPKYLWAKATNIVVHVLNRTMTRVLDGLTTFEKRIRVKLNISHSQVFGYFAYKHILKEL
jgi:hypothetical protein